MPVDTIGSQHRTYLGFLCVLGLCCTSGKYVLAQRDGLFLFLGPFPICLVTTHIPWTAVEGAYDS